MTSFDYIIAGAVSAGCVLANRLSHDPRFSDRINPTTPCLEAA